MSLELPTDVVSASVVAGVISTPYRAAERGAPVLSVTDQPESLASLLTHLSGARMSAVPPLDLTARSAF